MKKKMTVIALTAVFSLSLGTSVFAQEVPSQDATSESINLQNIPTREGGEITTLALWNVVTNQGYQGLSYGAWVDGVSGPGPGTLTLSKTVSVSNTYSGTLTAKVDDITAAVGFSISATNSTTASYSIKVPNGKKYKIRYRPVYQMYKATQYTYSTDVGSSVLLSTDVIYPKKYAYLEYDYVEIK
ncbi:MULTISPECIES: hypothetical protein [Paenibacillus]|uniref:hypothetical protein n=1 Tax=Paenibacillus TaxID=44249 RepID=UPI0012B77439|nr:MULTISPECIES: hypothetical protein [Paenibacillus]MDP9700732.1 hypothetical protein [Paenibacillus intestini]